MRNEKSSAMDTESESNDGMLRDGHFLNMIIDNMIIDHRVQCMHSGIYFFMLQPTSMIRNYLLPHNYVRIFTGECSNTLIVGHAGIVSHRAISHFEYDI